MQIIKNIDGATATIALDGWLDTKSAPELGAELAALGADVTQLVLDCEKLEYISSAGLRQLLVAYKQMKGALTLCHVTKGVMEVLSMTGFDQKLTIEP